MEEVGAGVVGTGAGAAAGAGEAAGVEDCGTAGGVAALGAAGAAGGVAGAGVGTGVAGLVRAGGTSRIELLPPPLTVVPRLSSASVSESPMNTVARIAVVRVSRFAVPRPDMNPPMP